ncbi:response regulator [soil metagenome]
MILIVDDKPENIFALKQLLDVNGFEVDTAASGEDALKKVLKHNYEVIILDVQMPGMDGFEVAEAISGYSKAKDTPIIFLSAVNTDKRFITKGYASGCFDYITKPVDYDILLLKIKTFQKLHNQTRQLIEAKENLIKEIEIRKEAEMKKDEFISIASHELKTPLTSIKAYLQLLQITLPQMDKKTIAEYLNTCSLQIEKLNDLIFELLDISQIENGKIRFNKKPVNFSKILNDSIAIIKQTNPDFNIDVNGDPDIQLQVDEMRIEQVLINYLSNAIKYSPDSNDVRIKIEVRNQQLIVGVKDFGIGIDPQKQRFIFEKFYRAEDKSTRFQGLGIGLYICSEILVRHNGTYGFKSTPGKGSEFYFKLPLQKTLVAYEQSI